MKTNIASDGVNKVRPKEGDTIQIGNARLAWKGVEAKGIMHRSSKDIVIGIVCIVLAILAAFGSHHVTTVHPDWWISKALVQWSQWYL